MAVKLAGKYLEILWTPDVGSPITISPKSRNWKVTQKGNSIDVSTRDDILAGQKDKIPDAPDRTATLSGLDTDENAPLWIQLIIGDTGVLREYRRTSASGRPYREWDAIVTTSDLNSPHDNMNDWSLEWELTTATVSGIV
jgi:hypothetical protein